MGILGQSVGDIKMPVVQLTAEFGPNDADDDSAHRPGVQNRCVSLGDDRAGQADQQSVHTG